MKPEKERLASGEENVDRSKKVVIISSGHMSFDDHEHEIVNQGGRDSEFATSCYGHMNF